MSTPAYVVDLRAAGPGRVADVGGKGASLGALSRLLGGGVPEGFCVTTAAFSHALASEPGLGALLDRLEAEPADVRACCAEIRRTIEGISVPEAVQAAIVGALSEGAWAVRSSATAEDLPQASAAGLHDSWLDVAGADAVLRHVRLCWASLFTERAAAYRVQRGIRHRAVRMAVVVQRMVDAEVSGVLFTADPATSDRTVSVVEAVSGLGADLVSGRRAPDRYTIRGGQVDEGAPAFLARLARLGRQVEAHLGAPQDIEWCLAGGALYVVQSRPITTLFPIPSPREPGNRVFISVGHQQMMTDALRPLGLSLFQATAARPMYAAGGRLFVDATADLADDARRGALLGLLARAEPLTQDALTRVWERDGFLPRSAASPAAAPRRGPPVPAEPSDVPALIRQDEAAVAALEAGLRGRTGAGLLALIEADIQALRARLTDPRSMAAIMAGMGAAAWLNEKMQAWLGEESAADTLSQSAPGNVTSEMGLALLDVADAVRPHPAVIAYLRRACDAGFWEGLAPLPGGDEAGQALSAFLARYGMRCPGEIDVTRPRWAERPTMLAPLILSHVQVFSPGASARKRARGARAAEALERSLLSRLRALPDGAQRAAETEQQIRRLRAFIGYREHPKYNIICRYAVYREALRGEAARLVAEGVLDAVSDVWFLSLAELRAVAESRRRPEAGLVAQRRAEHERHVALTPPRVITSDGEIVRGAYRRAALAEGALVGLPVSAGVVEGRARVLRDLADAAEVQAGDILVTRFTDPGWTPLFVTVGALVTEVGGLMTHGAVIAREYGLPAVVGVEDATRQIRDGQRVRVDGTAGTVEILGVRGP